MSGNRMLGLDGLRGIAILAVLLIHGFDDVPARLRGVAAFGWSGVDLFFVLSGFLITGGLLRSKLATNYFFSFYARRILRIFPVYYLMLACVFFAFPYLPLISGIPPAHDRVFYFSYLNNWTPLLRLVNSEIIGHFWSLAIEEQFYFLWPAVVLLASRKQLYGIAILGILAAPVIRGIMVMSGVQPETIYRNTFCRIDPLMIGALCALIASNRDALAWFGRYPNLLFACAVAGLLLCMRSMGPFYTEQRMLIAGLSLNAVCFGMLLLGCLSMAAPTRLLTVKPLRSIGLWSYGIYVYHPTLINISHRLAWIPAGVVRLIAESAAAITVAAGSYYLLELPILRFKKQFEPNFTV